MSYVISHPEGQLVLKLEEIAQLHVHEETIEEIVEALRCEWEATLTVRHPIMVDANTHVILDGTHRLQTLRRMGCHLIPVCLVDYENPGIEVKRWVRIASTAQSTLSTLPRDLAEWGYRFKKVPATLLTQQVLRREAIGMKMRGDSYALPQNGKSIKDIYATVKNLEVSFKSNGYQVRYATECPSTKRENGHAAIIPPLITKGDVRQVTLRGDVFSHKSTRHVFPARTLSVNVPVEWLFLTVDKANRLFLHNLSGKRCTYVKRPQAEDLYRFQ
jgi:hypothetical protein